MSVTTPASPTAAMSAVSAGTRDFLAWVARAPRTYADAMDTWRSTCPRYTVWEDALQSGLVQIERSPGLKFGADRVTLTPLGQTVLAADCG